MDLALAIGLISSIAAALAAIAAWRTAILTNKQFKFQQIEIENKYKPIFKINGVNNQPNGYLFDLTNIGFPFYAISAINWDGDGVEVLNDFNGIIEKVSTKKNITEAISKRESLVITIKVDPDANTEGFLEVNGFDLNQNAFQLKSPLVIIKNGKITNGIKITQQFMK